MGLLDGQIRNAIYAGFKGKLLKGTLTRSVPGGGLDQYGDPVSSTTQNFPCEGFVDRFSAVFLERAGLPETDVRVLILAASIATVPTKDDRVTFRGTTYQIRRIIDVDPAEATYTMAAFRGS